MRMIPAALLALFLALPAVFAEEPAAGKQVEQSLTTSTGLKVPYLLYLPRELPASGKAEVVLFLHGRGESRGPLSLVAKWGPPRLAARGDELPFIVISPQCPADTRWTADEQQAGVLEVLDHVLKTQAANSDRVYLTGLSMGGYGVWKMAANHAKRFVAAVPICGGGNPADAEKLKDLPLWVFHGTEDDPVPHQLSVDMVEAIRKAGGQKVLFTSMQHVGHNCWSSAFALPELYSWMGSQ